jgi:hypothetical protein
VFRPNPYADLARAEARRSSARGIPPHFRLTRACKCPCARCVHDLHCNGDKCDEPERGQILAIVAIAMMVLLGMAALTIDVGSWYVAKRKMQAAVDSAALAGAQRLPNFVAARDLAAQYAATNGPTGATFTYSGDARTLDVIGTYVAPGIFSKVFGRSTVTISAEAAASSLPLYSAQFASPLGIPESFAIPGNDIQVDAKSPNNHLTIFALDGAGATASVAEWIESGYSGTVKPGNFRVAPPFTLSALSVQSALQDRLGSVMLAPVTNNGAAIVGWAAVRLNAYQVTGSCSKAGQCWIRFAVLSGLFRGDGDVNVTDFGAHVIRLVR